MKVKVKENMVNEMGTLQKYHVNIAANQTKMFAAQYMNDWSMLSRFYENNCCIKK